MSDPDKREIGSPQSEGDNKKVDLDFEKENTVATDSPESASKKPARKKRKDDLEVTIAPGLENTSDIALGPPR